MKLKLILGVNMKDLDDAKKSKKVRYWISYRMPDGKQRRESLGAFEGLDPYSIRDARDAESKRVLIKTLG